MSELATTGKDSSIEILLAGAPKAIAEKVRVEVSPIRDVTRTKPLGTTRTRINTEPAGWKITVEIECNNAGHDELLDLVIAGEMLRVLVPISLIHTRNFRDLTKKRYLYGSCKLISSSDSTKRGENDTVRLEFESGDSRIAM